ncbi:MAG TPA: aminoglycoside phosphotransferase family protein [bacterium]|nr:aminoglycoside phosphotransferase family protein [bacterium]
MNKILSLFDKQTVRLLLEKEVLPLYPEFEKIVSFTIKPYKKLIWTTTYHVVVAYRLVLAKANGEEHKIEIVCSAHSHEARENVFKVLNFLWNSGLPGDGIALPRPLFFNSEFNGTFYRAIEGKNLLNFIKLNNREKVKSMVVQAAGLFARLHALSLPANAKKIFVEDNSLLRTVVPGRDLIVWEIGQRFQEKYVHDIADFYDRFIKQEEEFFASTTKRWLIHGDAHPENVIAVGADKIGLIDFTDFCLADFARDFGAFMQQLEYKIKRNLQDDEFALAMKRLFLNAYLQAANISLDESLQRRLDLYYNWTATRTATFWLLKHECEPEKAEAMIALVKNYLNTNHHAQD